MTSVCSFPNVLGRSYLSLPLTISLAVKLYLNNNIPFSVIGTHFAYVFHTALFLVCVLGMSRYKRIGGIIMKNFVRYAIAATAFTVALPIAQANAATLVVDVAGIQSFAEIGDPDNVVQLFNIGAGSTVTGISYNVNITAFPSSWLSEIGLFFGSSSQSNGLFFTPGISDENPGTGTYADSADLTNLGLDFAVGADGLLRLEYFEDFDDFSSFDGVWNSGTITFTYEPTVTAAVPEPATWAMMLIGFGVVGTGLRRRNAVKTTVTYA